MQQPSTTLCQMVHGEELNGERGNPQWPRQETSCHLISNAHIDRHALVTICMFQDRREVSGSEQSNENSTSLGVVKKLSFKLCLLHIMKLQISYIPVCSWQQPTWKLLNHRLSGAKARDHCLLWPNIIHKTTIAQSHQLIVNVRCYPEGNMRPVCQVDPQTKQCQGEEGNG